MLDSSTALFVLLPLMIISLIFSSFFSASETAITSINVIRLKQLAKGKRTKVRSKNREIKSAKRVYKFIKDYDRTLATILMANTLINTALATIGALFFATFIRSEATATWVATAVIGVVVLIFGEIVPKIIAKRSPEKFSIFASYILWVWKIMLYPFTWLLVLKKEKPGQVSTTENELLELISTIESEGVLEKNEKQLIESAITFDEKNIGDVMRDKEKVKAVFNDTNWRDLQKIYKEERFTRMPIISRTDGSVEGILNIKDVLIAIIDKKEVNIKELASEPIYISKHLKLDNALELLQQEQVHMAIVTPNHESKTFIGVVTMEDIIEELVGEIYDEDDETGQVKEIGHHMYWMHGNTPIKKVFKKYLQLNVPLKAEGKTLYQWYVAQTGYEVTPNADLPEDFVYHNFAFRINREKTKKLKTKSNNVKSKDVIFEIEILTDSNSKDQF